jgi:hypothetical protein
VEVEVEVEPETEPEVEPQLAPGLYSYFGLLKDSLFIAIIFP